MKKVLIAVALALLTLIALSPFFLAVSPVAPGLPDLPQPALK